LNFLDESVGNSLALVIFEDKKLGHLRELEQLSDHTHFITTAAFLKNWPSKESSIPSMTCGYKWLPKIAPQIQKFTVYPIQWRSMRRQDPGVQFFPSNVNFTLQSRVRAVSNNVSMALCHGENQRLLDFECIKALKHWQIPQTCRILYK
jgi:hypothetical protein